MSDPNAAGFAALEDKIAMFRVRMANVTDECVADVAAVMSSEKDRTIGAQTDAYGVPWKPKKVDDGAFRFVKASDVVIGSIGKTIIMRIRPRVVVLHHNGFAKGDIARPVIPVGGKIPPRMATRIKATVLAHFRKAVTP